MKIKKWRNKNMKISEKKDFREMLERENAAKLEEIDVGEYQVLDEDGDFLFKLWEKQDGEKLEIIKDFLREE